VDFALRRKLLEESKSATAETAWQRRDEGLAKLWLIQRTLALRARKEKAFAGSYEPLFASGKASGSLVAFVRGGEIITVVSRFGGVEGGSRLRLPAGEWRHEFTGDAFSGEIDVAGLFRKFPVALLVRREAA